MVERLAARYGVENNLEIVARENGLTKEGSSSVARLANTPARWLALAGFSTGAYPVASPGGYQVLGRLAVNVYEPQPRNAAFPADGVLLRAGDRLRYRNVGALEYDRIWSEVKAGRYEYEVIEEEFDVAGYVREFGRAAADAP